MYNVTRVRDFDATPIKKQPNWGIGNEKQSRFNEDFIEICTIGKGHFGSVVRCQNKLDGIEYAIKITERQHPKMRVNMYEALQEAYALAALTVSSENPYIVRYYRGWIEDEQLYIQMEL